MLISQLRREIRKVVAHGVVLEENSGRLEQLEIAGSHAVRRFRYLEISQAPPPAEFDGGRVARDVVARRAAERAADPRPARVDADPFPEEPTEAPAACENRGTERGHAHSTLGLPSRAFACTPRGRKSGLRGRGAVACEGGAGGEQRSEERRTAAPAEAEDTGLVARVAARLLDLRRPDIQPHLSRGLCARGTERRRATPARKRRRSSHDLMASPWTRISIEHGSRWGKE